MTISAKSIKFDEYNIWVELSDARTLGVTMLTTLIVAIQIQGKHNKKSLSQEEDLLRQRMDKI